MFKRNIKAAVAALSIGAIALALAACGSDNSASKGDSADGGMTKLTIAVSPGAATSAPMYLALKNGVFKKHDLDVKLTVLQNGSVAIPQVVSGQTQFSMASFAPAAQAIAQGVGVKLVGAANVIPTDDSTKYQGIIVRDGIKDLSQVKTFAAASTEIDPVQAMAVDKMGGDYKSMKLLAVPFPAIGDAVRQGNADAALLSEPFLTATIKAGGAHLYKYVTPAESLPGTPGAVFIGSDKYMAANPKVTQNFLAAIQEAYSYAQDHLQEVANFVPSTKLSDKVPPVVALGQYQQGPLDPQKVGEMLALFQQYGVLDKSITADKLVYQQ